MFDRPFALLPSANNSFKKLFWHEDPGQQPDNPSPCSAEPGNTPSKSSTAINGELFSAQAE